MNRPLSLAVVTLALVLGLLPTLAAQDQAKLRVLYVTGQNNHDWTFTSKHWREVLEKTGRFEVTTTEQPAEFLARENLAPFDLFFLDYNGARWGEAAEKRFQDAVAAGKGVFFLHAADNAFPGWRGYEQMSCLCFREKSGHGSFHAFDVQVVDRNHVITRDLPHLRAHPDELYHRLQPIPGAQFRVLLTAESSGESGGSGNEEPMALIGRFGKGRIFHTTLGHVWPGQEDQRASVLDPQLQLLVARGAEWAASGDCSIDCTSFGLEPFTTHGRHPRSPWVLRCVLDGRARMIVIGLDEMMNVAWDATHCEPYEIWGGGLKLQGAVFDAVHGPQPQIQGLPFFRNEVIASSPVVVGGEGRRYRFLGYRFDEDGRIVLRYRPGDLPDALIEETLEHGGPGAAILIRTFTISGLPEGRKVSVSALGARHRYDLGNETRRLVESFPIEKGVQP
ncbi:MAG: ThuA domain-containing protein [Planctomycetes bacterium]|nr:ThuA domain-containing protein [Planctomycetota bacterium]